MIPCSKDRKTSVVYLIPHLGNCGPVTQLFSLLNCIDSARFDCHVLTLFSERNNSMLEEFGKLGISISSLALSKKNILSVHGRLKHALKVLEPDIIHSESVITDILLLNNNYSSVVITTAHNYPFEDLRLRYGKSVGTILAMLEIRSMKKMNRIIPCSNIIAKKYERIIDRSKITVIQNGLCKPDICVKKDEAREKLGFDKHEILFVSTGAFIKRKQPELIIKAFELAQISNARLIMLGDGELLNKCIRSVYGNNILFMGRVNDPFPYLVASDIFVSLSVSEGLPYGVMEAGMLDLRMILSDIPEHREIADEIGNIEEWVDLSQDVNAVANCLKRSAGSKKEYTYNMNTFSASEMAKKYEKIYMNIVG